MEKNPTVVFRQPGQVVLEEREKPSPQPGELLIQTRRTLLTHREPFTEACRLYAMLLQDRSQAMGVLLTWMDGC